MCFNEIHVEFDAEGNAYLGDDAEDISYPGEDPGNDCPDHDDCWCAHDADLDVETDPDGAYEAILDDLPESARTHLEAESSSKHGRDATPGHNPAEGD